MKRHARILVTEDAPDVAALIKAIFQTTNFEVCGIADTGKDAVEEAGMMAPDLVLMDIGLNGGIDGIEAAKLIQTRYNIPIVYVTGHTDDRTLQRAVATSPLGYVTKPFQPAQLLAAVEVALCRAIPSSNSNRTLPSASGSEFIGSSPQMERIRDQIRELASVDSTVFIDGETGTGKELVARAIHSAGRRSHQAFITVNCPALTDSLLASQLFGHKRGAFTGASHDHEGFFEVANGGTIFLDEIESAALSVQTTLLRVLEEREITRLGESRSRKVDVRVLAATNRDLDQEVAKGAFRSDLLYRIRVARVALPRLQERREDIPELVDFFISRCRTAVGKCIQAISPTALAVLTHYRWPGNIRELRNAIEFAAIRAKGYVIEPEDLPEEIIHSEPEFESILDDVADDSDRIRSVLERTGGNRTRAAQLLGISRATLYRRLASDRVASQEKSV